VLDIITNVCCGDGDLSVCASGYWKTRLLAFLQVVTWNSFLFRICNKEGPGKPGVTERKWDNSASGLC
jgi:hypothetical protein